MSTIIAPSLLSADFLNLEQDIKRFEGLENLWLHLDVMDGHFVPNLTFGATVLKNVQKISSHKLDAHFMVTNPEDYIIPFKEVGLHNFTFHWEVVKHHDRMIHYIKEHYPSAGISLNPSTPVEVIPEYLFDSIDLILIMTVNPGFGGQSFIAGCKDKISKLSKIRKDKNLNFKIQVDGGVSDKNAAELIALGADNLVAGSYIFKDPKNNYASRVNNLR